MDGGTKMDEVDLGGLRWTKGTEGLRWMRWTEVD